MEFETKKSVEPSISLFKLAGAMDLPEYQDAYKSGSALLDEDHSLVIDFSGVTQINDQGIQAIIALSQRAKRFNNVVVVFGLADDVAQAFHRAGALEELTITNNNYEAMSIAQHLQTQKGDVRKITFGRKVETPPGLPSKVGSTNANGLDSELPANIENSPIYKMVESRAREAASWNSILDERLGADIEADNEQNPHDSDADSNTKKPARKTGGLETLEEETISLRKRETKQTPSPSQGRQETRTETPAAKERKVIPATHATPKLLIDEGISGNEKDALFDDNAASPTASSSSASLRSSNRRERRSRSRSKDGYPQSQSSKLTPILLFLVLVAAVLNFFKDPIYALIFPEKYQLALQMMDEPSIPNVNTGKNPTDTQENANPTDNTPSSSVAEALMNTTPTTNTQASKKTAEIEALGEQGFAEIVPMQERSILELDDPHNPLEPQLPFNQLLETHVNQLSNPTTANPFNSDGLFDQPSTIEWREQTPQEFNLTPSTSVTEPIDDMDETERTDGNISLPVEKTENNVDEKDDLKTKPENKTPADKTAKTIKGDQKDPPLDFDPEY